MARLTKSVTPDNRLPFWKKLWATPRVLDQTATDEAFEEFQEGLIPKHMHKMFLKSFGAKKDQLNNRFFVDEASFQSWDTKLQELFLTKIESVEAIVIYGSPDRLEAHQLKGQPRRTLRDIVMDDWQAACGIVRAEGSTVYLFVEPKMRGCIVRLVKGEEVEDEPEIEEE